MRDELPRDRAYRSTNPTEVAPARRNPDGVVESTETLIRGRPARRSNPGRWVGIPLGFLGDASDARRYRCRFMESGLFEIDLPADPEPER